LSFQADAIVRKILVIELKKAIYADQEILRLEPIIVVQAEVGIQKSFWLHNPSVLNRIIAPDAILFLPVPQTSLVRARLTMESVSFSLIQYLGTGTRASIKYCCACSKIEMTLLE